MTMSDNSKKRKLLYSLSLMLVSALLISAITLVSIYFATRKTAMQFISLRVEQLEEENLSRISQNLAFGAPSAVQTNSGKIIIASTQNNGPVTLLACTDGENWQTLQTPFSNVTMRADASLFTLNFTNGDQALILFAANPAQDRLPANGISFSLSFDDGQTWSNFSTIFNSVDCAYAMSSVTQLKNGAEFTDQWLCTFTTNDYQNFSTVLTFNSLLSPSFSTPQEILSGDSNQNLLYNPMILRADDTLIMILSNAKRTEAATSMICFSYDEGSTWTLPKSLPNDLSGENFSAINLPDSDDVVITFKQITSVKPNALSTSNHISLGWCAWIGDLEGLLKYQYPVAETDRFGDKLVLISADTSITPGSIFQMSNGELIATASEPNGKVSNFIFATLEF